MPAAGVGAARAEQVREVERWFMARGTPHLMDGYSATQDVFTRTLPSLTLVLLLELGGALNADFTWWQNALAAVAGIGVLLGVWAAVNAWRRRPRLARPARAGRVELATFVLLPALLTMTIGGQVAQGLGIAALNLALLVAIYLVTSYGLVPMTRWAIAKTVRELGAVAGLLGRALPLLLLIQIVLFINTEMWQVADGLNGWFLGAVVLLFLGVGVGFLLTRLPRELGRLATFASTDELKAAVVGTPAVELLWGRVSAADLEPAPLSARQRGNVMLVALFSQGVQVVLVTLILGAFFVVFGLLTITPEVIESWLGHAGHELLSLDVGGRQVLLTEELLKISGFLAAFSGLYFTVVLVTDGTYREEFFDEILAELRQTFAVRAVYRRALK
ncbi:MAG: hypothetical protein M3Z03_13620 [Actinomycetota bacterium]|nr:hypothetical protein [Actinomycetota bacterium]